MTEYLQSTVRRVLLKAYLSSDHTTPAIGKTIAVVISKNGAAFGNPSAGATNATAIGSGWYYVDMSTTDTATLGPHITRGTCSGVDDVEVVAQVVAGYALDLTQTGLTPRSLNSVADSALTVGDALLASICSAAGKESVVSTTYTVKTPSTGSVIRTFTLDSGTVPSSRN